MSDLCNLLTEPFNANLDCESSETLQTIWHAVHVSPVRLARVWFPGRPAFYVQTTRMLGAYASNKAAAQYCRLRGDIVQASNYETICDRIYQGLPDYARTW